MTDKKPSPDEIRHQIQVRAYLIWEREGRPHGREHHHWGLAEAEILSELPAQKAPPGEAESVKPAAQAKPAAPRPVKAPAKKKAAPKPKEASAKPEPAKAEPTKAVKKTVKRAVTKKAAPKKKA